MREIYRWDKDTQRLLLIKVTGGGVADVYFKEPYWDPHLASEDHPGPKFISSREEKKYWLEKCNLCESGDRVHGARSFDPIAYKHARESLTRRPKNG
jgi:hypothetical protein